MVNNNLKELLNMFWAAHHIQENAIGKENTSYTSILEKLKDLHKDISDTLEGEMFNLCQNWDNDLLDLIDNRIIVKESKASYFEKNVKKYVDEYLTL